MCLGLTGNMRDADRLVKLLHHDDYFVVSAVEKSIWSIWMRASNPVCVTWLHQAIDCMQANHHEDAESLLDLILIKDPDFAEACNQRAILHHLTGRYESSMMACHRTLALNPKHYGAAAGLGHNYFHLGQFNEARDAYHKALAIHPRMEGIRQAIRRCNLAAAECHPHACR
jgi:tetratricopeptide (TPR) repeat protein